MGCRTGLVINILKRAKLLILKKFVLLQSSKVSIFIHIFGRKSFASIIIYKIHLKLVISFNVFSMKKHF